MTATPRIPALKMIAADSETYRKLLAEAEKEWSICSFLPFVTRGAIAAVVVGQKRSKGDFFRVDDERYYVVRVYSDIAGLGTEYHSRHTDRAEAIAARFDAAEGHAELIYDNTKAS